MGYKRRDLDKSEWWAGSTEEGPFIGPFSSRDDAISEARSEFEGNETAVLGHPQKYALCVSSGDAESLIENLGEHLADELYEEALDNWCIRIPRSDYQVLADRLTPVIIEWLKERYQHIEWDVIYPAEQVTIREADKDE